MQPICKVWLKRCARYTKAYSRLVVLILVLAPLEVHPEMVFSQPDPRGEEGSDKRGIWFEAVMTLALDKTVPEYGEYRYERIPAMKPPRALKSLENNRYPNFFFPLTYEARHQLGADVAFIEFPIQLGMLGYRVCFYSRNYKEQLDKDIQEGQLKTLSIGQGELWTDTKVLRHNGYRTTGAPVYESMFDMTALGRFDLFCRSALEIYDEYQRHKRDLEIEPSFAFYYKLPKFFYVNKNNKEAIARVRDGLVKAHEDGSLWVLFKSIYGQKLSILNLKNRKIIKLENPLLDGLDSEYEKYNIEISDIADFYRND